MNALKRISLWLLLLAAFAVPAMAQPLAEALEKFKNSPGIDPAATALLVVDLKTGEEVLGYNSSLPLIPASIMKCVSTATLLEKVGSKYRYETPVYLTGKMHKGVIEGNLVIKASGDPSIATVHEPGSSDIVKEITDALTALRVTEIQGDIVIDESDFPGPVINPTWQKGDLPHAYGTGSHGFNYEDNASGKKSVSDPAAIFKARLRNSLANAGISLTGVRSESDHRSHKLGEHRSETIDELMRSCMMRSDNQFAEAFLRTVGLEYGKDGATATGAAEETKYWKRKHANLDGVKIVDGSGLSRSNSVTADFMADVLTHMSGNPYYASFFPLAGQEGTLKKFLAETPLDGEIAMKTGSMNGIQCYAGYKLDSEYAPTHVVVVIMNNLKNRATARAALEQLLLTTFSTE